MPLVAAAVALVCTSASSAHPAVGRTIATAPTLASAKKTHAARADASLTIAVPIIGVATAPAYVTEALGYVNSLGDKMLVNTGANTLPLLASGNADLAFFGTGTAIVGSGRGLAMKAIWQTTLGGLGGVVAIPAAQANNIKSYKDLDGKKIGVLGTSGESYGAANVYAHISGVSPVIVPFGSTGAELAALESGQISAAVASYDLFLPGVEAGLVKILIDTASGGVRKSLNFHAGASIMGVGPNLDAKRSAVVAYLAALYKAERYIFTHTDAQVADLLLKLSEFQGFDRSQLIKGLAVERLFFPFQFNFLISSETWAQDLKEFVDWNLPNYSPASPAFSYQNMVDMSYLRSALPKPATVTATVAANGTVSFSKHSVLAGGVKIVVHDRSTKSGLIFNGKRITKKGFVGNTVVTMVLKGGHYKYSSDVKSVGFLSATF